MATKTQLVESVLARLRSALGTGEEPDGSNHNFITVWYNENVDHIGDGPWCEMTATWAMWTAGPSKALKRGRAYTVYGAHDGQGHVNGSSWHSGVAHIQAGDQVYFDWSGSRDADRVDHTGIVEKVNSDGTFYTLEGNTSNKLQRKLRDAKYVAGYVRFDWESLSGEPAPHPSPNKPAPAKPAASPQVVQIQRLLETTADGQWGPHTDARAELMRTASRAHAGYPTSTPAKFDIRTVQAIVNTKVDGIWGPNSQAALVTFVKRFQSALGTHADGKWGPATEQAFNTARHKYLMR